jgi:hypothetical protein
MSLQTKLGAETRLAEGIEYREISASGDQQSPEDTDSELQPGTEHRGEGTSSLQKTQTVSFSNEFIIALR